MRTLTSNELLTISGGNGVTLLSNGFGSALCADEFNKFDEYQQRKRTIGREEMLKSMAIGSLLSGGIVGAVLVALPLA